MILSTFKYIPKNHLKNLNKNKLEDEMSHGNET